MQDNRQYDYTGHPENLRDEYPIIASLVSEGARVIDLGCGNGSRLRLLRDQRRCVVSGVELSPTGVASAKAKGLDVKEGRIDEKLPFRDGEFDYAVCNVTIQMVLFPEVLLREMGRIAKRQIVSFPNFAHYRNRLELLIHGRMPRALLFGYAWYSTGHIHQLSARDFEEFARELGFRVRRREVLGGGSKSAVKRFLSRRFPNLFAVTCIYELDR